MSASTNGRTSGSSSDLEAGSERLASVAVSELMTPEPLCVSAEATIQSAAQLMHEHRISCLPVVVQERLVGLLTEADFVGRVVAQGLGADELVKSVMSANPLCVKPQQSVLDVLTLMTRHRVAHMPCTDAENRPIGIVTQTDVIRHQIASSVFMVGEISRMDSSASIANVVSHLPRLLCSLIDNGGSAYETGRVMTSITGAVTRRLIELAILKLGDAPLPFVWLACGSQGRQEQTGATDQDNCLILDDGYSEDVHGQYFMALANFVCDGLNEAGYVYCPGDMMASNVKWRQPLSVWRSYFKDWIERPGSEAQMLASVMFDLRPIFGEESLFEPLKTEVLEMARSNSIFVVHMTSNSLAHRPPLGMFGRFVTEKSGTHIGMLDLKHGGTVPIVDLARLYALSAGLSAVNTVDRLKSDVPSPVLSPSGAASLADAFETISMIRLQHQVRKIKQGSAPDNFLDPEKLDSIQRDRLRSAMKSVKSVQAAMGNRIAVVGR